ncbi:EVE domain-containing protein [Coxiella burnetii]|uniref:EVE domain-containing protein n=1 Tax=Coxiella burnetii TaxID=777 RepID=UPI0005929173|nr:EVE domain-containing protein [Coxiella burnetii]ATN74852.1 EVE domain-containing protein [Coxiella burnetii]ATN76756.1 EVE domain-containing protein [Coxiella burnetii]ATN78673.1 EVE domain-containing protein [Coxiella burnetii]ATN80583.1 EVE domain-containing protein [Coxiella burnetii]OYK90474.1 EVE domain-containing protein [Coxiella burnetii]
MNYWLLKSEPTSYSIDDLFREKNKITRWDGVRNYQARNFMRDGMKKGDLAFFYHSNCEKPGIVGVFEVVRESYPDLTALDPEDHHYDPKSTPDNPRWLMVDIKFRKKFPQVISLQELRQNPKLKDLLILCKGNRLSITPVSKAHWDAIMKLE